MLDILDTSDLNDLGCSSPLVDSTMMPSSMVSARLTTSERGRQFYHVVASVVQDADVYFSLCSTSGWVRGLYLLAGWIHATWFKEWMVRGVLWVQLRTVFYEND